MPANYLLLVPMFELVPAQIIGIAVNILHWFEDVLTCEHFTRLLLCVQSMGHAR
jgi:hypothetical protein